MKIFNFPIFLCSIFCLIYLGCSPGGTNVEKSLESKVLYIGIGSEPEGLDPHLVSGVTEHYVLLSLFEGLTTLHPESLKIQPGVASHWTISEDNLTYTFFLDPKAKWSNGDNVTAYDFLFSYNRILSPELGAPYANMLYPIRGAEDFNKGLIKDFNLVGIKAIDNSTLQINLHSPTPYFLSLPSHFTWWPVHPPTILKHGSMNSRISKWTKPENFIGNGPFSLKSWRLNNSIVVEKNKYYKNSDSTFLNGINFLPLNLETEERAFRTGQIHITSGIPNSRIDWYKKNKPNNIRFDPYLGTYYYLINTTKSPLTDKKVRQALSYSIDRDILTKTILKGGQKPAFNFCPPNVGGYKYENQFSYDPDKAKQLLKDAGYPLGKNFPEIEILYNTSESHKIIAEAIQQMWKKELGINARLHNQEWKVYLNSRQNKSYDVARAAWIGDYLDPYTFLSLGITNAGNNHSGWSSQEFDTILDKAIKSDNLKSRYSNFKLAENILLEEMPFIPIYFYVRSILIDSSIEGWYPNILDYHPYQFISIKSK